ncbi:hypothetical protein SGQ83_12220 [Flavobacterium sp. Fl-318]|uniref:O-antigen ligase domain-containing protein n=1 Tax=Flavobacterium cupriresistens TaxID=2893885 RepID=A0ABU4RC01_9FLAO|nr:MULTISPECIES: hypothetical protein [unclassified Flavobacterium]MDX6190117.1 hypothetical protein [Flavobacterium sp. Fl-318]UFH42938.1 hypothetical protein LNP23_01670 [Flavobacterium sp. F-323]
MQNFLKYKTLEKILIFFLTFFYIYSVLFPGMPAGTRVLIGALGILISLFDFIVEIAIKKTIRFSKKSLKIIFLSLLIALFSLLVLVFKHTSDLEFVKYPFFIIQWFGGGYLLTIMHRKVYGSIKFENVGFFIVASVLLQVIIAFLMFVSSPIRDLFTSINLNEPSTGEAFREFRLVGFASYYFGAGIICGYALILIPLLIPYTGKKSQIRFLAFSFILILALGMMMSRTTMLGGAIAVLIMILPFKLGLNSRKKVRLFLMYTIIIPLFVLPVFFLLDDKLIETIQVASEFGFEMFYNYFNEGSLSTGSTDEMKEMYKLPNNSVTYLFGDGIFYANQLNDSSGYYMGTDIGFLRLVYYFGIIGSLLFFLLQFVVLCKSISYVINKRVKILFIVSMFLFLLVLNFKGLTDLIFLNVLFGGFWLNKRNKITFKGKELI